LGAYYADEGLARPICPNLYFFIFGVICKIGQFVIPAFPARNAFDLKLVVSIYYFSKAFPLDAALVRDKLSDFPVGLGLISALSQGKV
jgi:hypothetical protein